MEDSGQFRQTLLKAQDDGANALRMGRLEEALDRLFLFAGLADKVDGAVHAVPVQGAVLAMVEPIGVIGILCPEARPLAGLVGLVAPAIAMGNRVVVVPSQAHPLAATDFYQVLDTSDLPGGVVNIVTGPAQELGQVLALHAGVDALWYGPQADAAALERASAGNLKRVWAVRALGPRDILREATQIKNVWVPYGE